MGAPRRHVTAAARPVSPPIVPAKTAHRTGASSWARCPMTAWRAPWLLEVSITRGRTRALARVGHRCLAFPAPPLAVPPPAGVRIDQTQPHQRPVHRRLRRHRRHLLPGQLEHQTTRPPRRMRPPQLGHRHLHRRRHLMRTRAAGPHLRHRVSATDHRQHRPIPLLGHTQLPHGSRVSRINRNNCQASPDTLSGISRSPTVKRHPNADTFVVPPQGFEP